MITTIKVKGMHCNACEMLITDVLTDAPGVKNAQVSIKTNIATIEYDEKKIKEIELRKLIESEGYTTE